MVNEVLLLSDDEVKELLPMDDAIQAVKEALRAKGLRRVQMPPKLYISFNKHNGDFRTMLSYLEEHDLAGVKIVNVHLNNPQLYNIPAVIATIILIDPKAGIPLSMMAGTSITAMRTGAISSARAKKP